MESQGKKEKSSIAPLLIIVGIAIATIFGIYMVAKSGGSADNTNVATNSGETANSAVEKYKSAPPGATPANSMGPEDAKVVVEEFADFQCPTCGVVNPIMKEVVGSFNGRIKFIFRNYPLVQIHQHAYDAATASEAAGVQGKYWQMQEMIFKNQPTWSSKPTARPTFKEYAQQLGLDVEKFESDSLSLVTKTRVDNDIARGRALGISSTPTVLINGKPVPFEQLKVDSLKSLIEAELKAQGAGSDDGGESKPEASENK
ncbi:MAG: thioredoxin domain-containing protein [Pyrinomonadaceae bacterium]